jgi:hypothetical protein
MAWVALPRFYAPSSTALCVTGERKPPLHYKAVIVEQDEGYIICKIAENIRVLGCTGTYTPLEYTKLPYCMAGALRKQKSGAWLSEERKCNVRHKQIEQLME